MCSGSSWECFCLRCWARPVIFQDELKPSEVVNTIRRERVSVLVSVPRVLQSLKQKIERDLEDRGEQESFRRRFQSSEKQHFLRRWWTFRKIRRQFGWKFLAFISGGAALDGETEEFWGRLGYAVIQGYGLTETTSLISVNHPFRLGKGSIGKVLPGREVKLAEDGEILVRGGGVASGYWDGRGAQTASDEHISDAQGWYRTGDIGALDEAGNLYFKGRKKEVIVTPGGTNVYPEDLEAALRRQPEVKDCVVVGMERGGNAEPCAVVILRRRTGRKVRWKTRARSSSAAGERIAGGVSAHAHVGGVAGAGFSANQHAEAAAQCDRGDSCAGAVARASTQMGGDDEPPAGGVDCAGYGTVRAVRCARMRIWTPTWD